jgi:nitroreductase
MPELDLATVDHLLRTTRSVRRRLDLTRPVPRALIVECLRLANQAPSGNNAQLLRWLVVTDPGKRRALAEVYRAGNPTRAAEPTSPPAIDLQRTEQERRVADSVQYLKKNLERVPVHVIPCIPVGAGSAAGWAPSVYPAGWSLMLALRSRGVGTCLTTSHLWRPSEAAALLGIPEGWAQACLVAVAYFVGDDFTPAARRPVEESTFWDQWGSLET